MYLKDEAIEGGKGYVTIVQSDLQGYDQHSERLAGPFVKKKVSKVDLPIIIKHRACLEKVQGEDKRPASH